MGAGTYSLWVAAEHRDGQVLPVTYEVLALAHRVAVAVAGKITIIVAGRPALPVAEQLAETTGFDVIGTELEGASDQDGEACRHLIRNLARPCPPHFLFIPHTTRGWDLAPGLAVDLGASSLSAVCGLTADPDLTFLRRILNGKLLQQVRPVKDRPAVVTVVPGAERPFASKADSPGTIRILRVQAPPMRTRVLGLVDPPAASVNLREAEVVVAAGRGAAEEEDLECIRRLAGLFRRGAVGASRPLCDAGILPMACQVGMTGQTVSPKLYIGCGISGALQHTMGMKNSDVIIAVNTDPSAAFCREAHYSIVADLHAFLPILIDTILRFRSGRRD